MRALAILLTLLLGGCFMCGATPRGARPRTAHGAAAPMAETSAARIQAQR